MADRHSGYAVRRMGPGYRRGLVVAGLAVTMLVAVLPAFGNTPETGSQPGVTLTVAPSDAVSDGQTVVVTGAGFAPNTPGVIRQCGGTVAAPQCDLDVIATFVTSSTGQIPATNIAVSRIVDTGTTTFNCGVQTCALVATAGSTTSQHHIRFAGAGTVTVTIQPTTSSSSTSSSSTTTPTTTPTTIPTTTTPPTTSTSIPTTTVPPAPGSGFVCAVLRGLVGPFPFLRGLVDSLLVLLGCPPAA